MKGHVIDPPSTARARQLFGAVGFSPREKKRGERRKKRKGKRERKRRKEEREIRAEDAIMNRLLLRPYPRGRSR